MARCWSYLVILALLFSGRAVAPARGAESISFDRQIRPILSDKCFACHGPEEESRQGGFRIDEPESAFAEADSGLAPIVPGDPDASEIIARITSDDESLRMPPLESNKKLTAEEIELLRQWIAGGAKWEKHWSLVAPSRPEVPAVQLENWPRGEIDHFLLARLEREKLKPSPEADRVTLLRRVSLDLTGLPPTADEVDAFLADNRPDAYEHLVERLLASPRYGEHMARFWLDAARYGDTHGLHLDNYREMWPYRDWVVRAFNGNLSFKDFIIEQLAGDLLPSATVDQLIASGFNRCHVTTNEGGVIAEEVYVNNVIDRVDAFGTVMLGMTIGCSRCHDHKYDPIKMKEYYSLFAYFNSLDGTELDLNTKDPAPVVKAPTPDQQAQLAALDSQIAQLETRMNGDWPELDAKQAEWERQFALHEGGSATEPVEVGPSPSGYLAIGDWYWVGPFTSDVRYLRGRRQGPEGKPVDLNAKFKLATGEEVGWVRRPDWPDGAVHNQLPGDPAANFLYRTITVDRPQELELSLGSDDGIVVYLDGKQVFKKMQSRPAAADQDKIAIKLKRGENRLLIKILNFGGPSGFYFAAKSDLPMMPPDVLTAARMHAGDRSPEQQTLIRQFFRNNIAQLDQLEQLRTELAAVRTTRTEVDRQVPTTLIFRELPTPKPAYVLLRGAYDQHGEQVERLTPASLPPLPPDAPKNRLGLAHWVVAPENPLTARVAVNRFWQQFLGIGLVKTSDDFGVQGERPSHPELLDWLAIDFVENGWDVKRLVRQIVTSAAYRQTAKAPTELYRRDPDNRLLARGPRQRLDAEVLRDQALYVSGLLVEKLGGPSVKPPQPAGLWEAVGYSGSNTVKFVADQGHERIHRRTLYTFIKRTAPPPQMSTFDGPSREACMVRRERTNTPLQALLLLNDPQFVEAARGLAERTMREGGDDDESRAAWMFRTVACRPPGDQERADLTKAYREELHHYRADVEAARQLVASSTMPADPQLDPAELAAWTMAANVVLNLDEVVSKN